jgi:4-amino-4-deoxy-L-arabinose transferase-like glycosyltransferase
LPAFAGNDRFSDKILETTFQQSPKPRNMNLPAYLKPENGALGRVLAIWLDHAPKGLATRFLLLWFVLLYTAFAIISSASVGLHPDLLDAYARGLHPAAGYEGHAPLAALMAAGWFSLFPATDWAFHLLAMVNAAVGLYATDLIARRYLDGDKRIAVLLLLLLTPFYQFVGQRFGADQMLLSTWPIATYCFLRAFETRGLAWSAGAGAAAALALLGSYYSVFLLAGFVAAVLAHPGRRTYFRSVSPWVSVAAAALALAPHVQWLYATGFASLSELAAAHTGAPLMRALRKDALCVVEGVASVSLLLAVYWLAVRPDRTTLRETIWPADPDGRMLVALLAVPLILPAVVAPFIGTASTPLWTMPAGFLLPIVLLRPKAAELTRVAAIRITALVAAVTILTLAAAPWLAQRTHDAGTLEGREYYRLVSSEITNAWHLGTGLPLRIVMGDRDLASAVTFYSPDHPDAMAGFETASSPASEGGKGGGWITPDRLAQEGWAAICNADDEKCVAAARQRAAGKSNVQFITYSTTSRYLGKAGKLGRFFFILAAPESKPVIILQ